MHTLLQRQIDVGAGRMFAAADHRVGCGQSDLTNAALGVAIHRRTKAHDGSELARVAIAAHPGQLGVEHTALQQDRSGGDLAGEHRRFAAADPAHVAGQMHMRHAALLPDIGVRTQVAIVAEAVI